MSPTDPLYLQRVEALARQGLSDREIANEVGSTQNAITKYRQRHDIPPGVPSGRPAPSTDTIAARIKTRTQRHYAQYASMSDEDNAHRACADADPEVFFVPDGWRGPMRAQRVHEAKAICARCPVREACLEISLHNREEYGVFGGLDEEERSRIRRQWRQSGAVA